MKKNTFLQGTVVATAGIVITKLLGILYVIPFYAIIGEKGGALYGYSYNIYAIFLGIASVGLPLAMSKLISEYNALGYHYSKERAFYLGKRIITLMGVGAFILLILFAPNIAYLIIGNIKGGNTLEDVTFVIRIVSLAILIVPVLSISRGYLQGHKYITPTATSQVIEQIVRVSFIILGSYLALRVFHLDLSSAVGIAVFGAFIGALSSYLYLVNKIKHNDRDLNRHAEVTREEHRLTDRVIIKQLLLYAVPFVVIDISKNIYNSVDIVTLVRTLVNGLNYDIGVAESVMSIISTWGYKLNMIIMAMATGLIISLIPNLSSSFALNNVEDIKRKINQALQILIYITIPMTVGLSFLARPIWTTFYGISEWGPIVFSYFVFVALFGTLFSITIVILQSVNRYKLVFTCLGLGLLTKASLNIPLIYSFEKMGLYGFYGAITATILGYLAGIVAGLIYLGRIYNINYEKTLRHLFNIIFINMIMIFSLSLLKLIVPITTTSRLLALSIVILYTLVGSIIYLLITNKMKIFDDIFGPRLKHMVFRKLGEVINKKMP